MKQLEKTLLAKIGLTASLWCLPLISFPRSLYELLGFTEVGPIIFLRLLGFAYLALLVGYVLAYREAKAAIYPATIVAVGFVSNFGAFLVLLWGALAGQWAEWGLLAQLYMWGSAIATGSIAISLYLFGLKKFGWRARQFT